MIWELLLPPRPALALKARLFRPHREKKKEKEREDLWKKLEDLELKRGLRNDGIIPT